MLRVSLFFVLLIPALWRADLIKDRVAKWPPVEYAPFVDLLNCDMPPFAAFYNISSTVNQFLDFTDLNISYPGIIETINFAMQRFSLNKEKNLYIRFMRGVSDDIKTLSAADEETVGLESPLATDFFIKVIIIDDIIETLYESRSKGLVSFQMPDYCGILREIYAKTLEHYIQNTKMISLDLKEIAQKKLEKLAAECKQIIEGLDELLKIVPLILQPVSTTTHFIYRLVAQIEIDPNLPNERVKLIMDRVKGVIFAMINIKFNGYSPFILKWKMLEIVENLSIDYKIYLWQFTDPAAAEASRIMKGRLVDLINMILTESFAQRGIYSSFATMSRFFGKVLPFAQNETLMQVLNEYYIQKFRGRLPADNKPDSTFWTNFEIKNTFGLMASLYDANLINIGKQDMNLMLKNFKVLADFDDRTLIGLQTLTHILTFDDGFKFEGRIEIIDFMLTTFGEFVKGIDQKSKSPISVQLDQFVTDRMIFENIREYCNYLLIKLINFWAHPKELPTCTFRSNGNFKVDMSTQVKNMLVEMRVEDLMDKVVQFVYQHKIDFDKRLESRNSQRQMLLDSIRSSSGNQLLSDLKDPAFYDKIVPIFIEILFNVGTFRQLKKTSDAVPDKSAS